MNMNNQAQPNVPKSGLGIAALVLGLVALLTSFIPIINNFSFILGGVGLIFAVIALLSIRKGKKSGKGITMGALIVCIVSIVVVLGSQAMLSAAIDETNNELDKITGDATEQLLENDVDIVLGDFSAKKEGYGLYETGLSVKVTNKASESATYSVEVEAVDAQGNRILDDTVYANDLESGQSQTLTAFEYVESDKVDDLKKAEFRLLSVSQY